MSQTVIFFARHVIIPLKARHDHRSYCAQKRTERFLSTQEDVFMTPEKEKRAVRSVQFVPPPVYGRGPRFSACCCFRPACLDATEATMKIKWSWKIILFPAIVGILCFGNGLWTHGRVLAFGSAGIRTPETGRACFSTVLEHVKRYKLFCHNLSLFLDGKS